MNSQGEIYIGTGDKCGFYTLHFVTRSPETEDGFQDRYQRNLSTDWNKAFELDEVVFEIGETAFDFEKELLDAPLPHYLVEQAL